MICSGDYSFTDNSCCCIFLALNSGLFFVIRSTNTLGSWVCWWPARWFCNLPLSKNHCLHAVSINCFAVFLIPGNVLPIRLVEKVGHYFLTRNWLWVLPHEKDHNHDDSYNFRFHVIIVLRGVVILHFFAKSNVVLTQYREISFWVRIFC